KITHTICGHKFESTFQAAFRGRKCPKCHASESKGEVAVREFLECHAIQFTGEYPVKTTASTKYYRLDFLVHSDLFKNGVAIEYDGKQHFEAVDHFGGEAALHETKRRDRIKDKYCADNGIPLIRIPYWDFDNIDA